MCIFTLTQQTDFLKFINCGRNRIPVSLSRSKSSEAEWMPPPCHMQRLRGYFCPSYTTFSRNWGRTVKKVHLFILILLICCWNELPGGIPGFSEHQACVKQTGCLDPWRRRPLQLPVTVTAEQPPLMSAQSAVVVQSWALGALPLPVWSSFENRKRGKLPRSWVKSSCPLGLSTCLTGVRRQGTRLCRADVCAASPGGWWLALGKPPEAQRSGFEFCLSQNSISSHRGQLCGARSLKWYAKSKSNKNLNHTPGTYVSCPHGILTLFCVSSFCLRSAWEMMFF